MKTKTLIWLTLFSVAMGYLESSVVVYLRAIMYPDGFTFPLVSINSKLAEVEFYREVATMIMLLGAGIIAGRYSVERFAWFIYCFAIWDIFYYLFLKILLNWPGSFMTWDLLFLIPVAWVSPVIAPVIISFTMIVLALIIVLFSDKIPFKIKLSEWGIFITGSFIIIVSFIWDYSEFVIKNYSFSYLISKSGIAHLDDMKKGYIPQSFNWMLFIIGEIILISGILIVYFRLKKLTRLTIKNY